MPCPVNSDRAHKDRMWLITFGGGEKKKAKRGQGGQMMLISLSMSDSPGHPKRTVMVF